MDTLRMILATITEEHHDQFDEKATLSVCRLLRTVDDYFDHTAVVALGKAGHQSALPYIHQMAQHATKQSVRQAAQTAVALLEERQRNEDAQRTLLRPSAAPDEATLLRPASNAPTDDAALLLHPMPFNESDRP